MKRKLTPLAILILTGCGQINENINGPSSININPIEIPNEHFRTYNSCPDGNAPIIKQPQTHENSVTLIWNAMDGIKDYSWIIERDVDNVYMPIKVFVTNDVLEMTITLGEGQYRARARTRNSCNTFGPESSVIFSIDSGIPIVFENPKSEDAPKGPKEIIINPEPNPSWCSAPGVCIVKPE